MTHYELMTPAAITRPLPSTPSGMSNEVSLSLFISIGALRLVNWIESLINGHRDPKKG